MAQIALKNFRKFESLETLNLNDINIFVGKNNSGKSTVTKAIMLVLDNLRSLQWTKIPYNDGVFGITNSPKPFFRFNVNEYHNLHIGTFERAKCNWLDDPRITMEVKYGAFKFEITVAALADPNGQANVPIEKLKITVPDSNCWFDFSFQHPYSMTFGMDKRTSEKNPNILTEEIKSNRVEIKNLREKISEAEKAGDAIKVAELTHDLQKLRSLRHSLIVESKKIDANADINEVSFFLRYYHEGMEWSPLAQYIRTFTKFPDLPITRYDQYGEVRVGTITSDFGKPIKKGTKEYNDELAKRQFISEHINVIKQVAKDLEWTLRTINVDYIQAHAATQKLILDANEKNDINSVIVDEFYKENIQPGTNADRFLKYWLKEFEIGNFIKVEPLEGEGYYVKVDTEDDEVHLADMGMGSIQLVILLLRLATIGSRMERTNQPCLVVVEEPEQNLHPKLQSLLADMFLAFETSFVDHSNNLFVNTLIIESHSEYLIRRTQIMVAESVQESGYSEEELKEENPITVFYFPTEREKQPYDMEYLPNGLFAKKFDSGFFDEAGNKAIQLMSIGVK